MRFVTNVSYIGMLLPALLNVGALSADTMDCTATEVHGMPAEGQPAIAPQLVCTTDEGFDIAFDGDVNLILDRNDFESGRTKLTIPSNSVSENLHVELNSTTLGEIAVVADPLSGGERRRLTREGEFSVLVIRVTDGTYSPSQDEAKMFNDVFGDENNLVSHSWNNTRHSQQLVALHISNIT
jgi:hypothetical protein